MNNNRRKDLARAAAILAEIAERWEEAKGIIEQARDDEQEYIDNMPESLQQSERAEAAEAAVSALESALELFDTDINDAISNIDEAMQ